MRRALSLTAVLALAGASGGVAALDPDKSFHHYVRNSWSIEEGLPQISALAITQDRQGYVWVHGDECAPWMLTRDALKDEGEG